MKKNEIKLGVILSYSQIFLGVVIGLIYTPLMIRLLGKSEYGLYNTVSSTISMLSILSLGFNSGYIRFYSRYKKENRYEDISKLNGMFLLIFLVIGFIALVCGLYLSNNLHLIFDEGLSSSEYQTSKILMILLTINLSISFPMSVFSNIISAHEKFVFLKTLALIKTVLGPFVTLPLLLIGYKSIGMVVVTLSINILVDILYLYYVMYALKVNFIFRDFDALIFKELFIYTSFIAINIIVDQINWNVDKVLLARYKGTGAVAVYSVGYTLFNYYMMFSSSISGLFTPRVHNMINQEKNSDTIYNEITQLFIKVGRIQFLILGLIATGLVFFGRIFITEYWAGPDYNESYYVLLLLVISSSIALIQNIGIEVQRAMNKHKFRSILYAGMACVNLLLSIVLCHRYGAVGCAFGTAVSLVLCNGIIMNFYYSRHCGINILLFWTNILKMARGMIIPLVLGVLLMHLSNRNSIFVFFVQVVLYTGIYCVSMCLFGMNNYEKSILKKIIKTLLRKI